MNNIYIRKCGWTAPDEMSYDVQEVLAERLPPWVRGCVDYHALCSGAGLRFLVQDILCAAEESDVVVHHMPNVALGEVLTLLGAVTQVSTWTSGTGVQHD